MKTNILTATAFVAAMMVATSCDDNWTPSVGTDGELDLSTISVINDDAEKLVRNEHSRADVDLSNYIVGIYRDGETSPVNTWFYGSMPEVVALPQGEYTVEVESHKVAKAEWETPYFAGSRTFSITANQITQVEAITCKFASVKVTVTVSDDLKSLLGDDATFTVIANDEGELVYGRDETRAGYFEALDGSNTMVVKFNGTLSGNTVYEVFTFTDIEAGQHRDIIFKAKGAPIPDQPQGSVEVGGISLDASYIDTDIDGNVTHEEEVIEGTRPGQEDPKDPVVDPDEPDDPVTPPVEEDPDKVIWFESASLDLVGVNNAKTHSGAAVVDIHSENGIAKLKVNIVSKSLTKTELQSIGLDSEFDLAEPGALKEAIEGALNLPTGDDVKGKNVVSFDITTFVPMLAGFVGDHNFELQVVDQKGIVNGMTLRFNVPE